MHDRITNAVRTVLRVCVTIPLAAITVILIGITTALIRVTDEKGSYGL